MVDVNERRNWGSFDRYLKTNDGGKVLARVSFENMSKLNVSSMEELAEDFLEKVAELVEKD